MGWAQGLCAALGRILGAAADSVQRGRREGVCVRTCVLCDVCMSNLYGVYCGVLLCVVCVARVACEYVWGVYVVCAHVCVICIVIKEAHIVWLCRYLCVLVCFVFCVDMYVCCMCALRVG